MYPIPPIVGGLANTGATTVPLAVAAGSLLMVGALLIRIAVMRRTGRRQ